MTLLSVISIGGGGGGEGVDETARMRQYIVPRLLANEMRKFQNLKCRLK